MHSNDGLCPQWAVGRESGQAGCSSPAGRVIQTVNDDPQIRLLFEICPKAFRVTDDFARSRFQAVWESDGNSNTHGLRPTPSCIHCVQMSYNVTAVARRANCSIAPAGMTVEQMSAKVREGDINWFWP